MCVFAPATMCVCGGGGGGGGLGDEGVGGVRARACSSHNFIFFSCPTVSR